MAAVGLERVTRVPAHLRMVVSAMMLAVALALVLLAGALVLPAGALAETRVALVIGNASYATNRLKNPRNDAGLMARSLAAAGFDVMTVMDGTADELRSAISDFGTKLQAPGAVALFYYAGHGVQVDGDNYLIPLGATIANMQDVREFGVPLQSVMRTMARSNTRLNIVVLDACRDNPFSAAGWTASVYGLASVVAPSGTIIAYATGPGQLADDGIGANSPYTAALASEMMTVGASLEDVFRATRRHVLERTGNRQTPWEHSSLVSQFSFMPAVTLNPANSVAKAASEHDARFAEMADWETIKSSTEAAPLQAHIQKYPNGLFAELASMRMARIEGQQTRAPWSWMATVGSDVSARFLAAMAAYDKARALDTDAASHGDLATAYQLYTEAAAEGLTAAMFRVGRAHDKGRGVSRDLLEAARWYGRAADANYPAGMAALGTMHEFGDGAAPDLVEALRLYRGAADGGDAGGMTSLGYLYGQGKGVARDSAAARRLYKAAADLNYPRAMYNLALMDIGGQGARADVARAHTLLSAAADLGHAPSLIELARLYDDGRGVARSAARAAELALKAVQAGHKENRFIDLTNQRWSYSTRRQIQKQLAAKGLYDGGIHGFFNSATRQALTAVAQR